MLLLALLVLSQSANAQKSYSEKMRKQINKLITYETQIDYALTPGFIVGIVDGEHSIVLSFGKRDLTSEDTILVDDVFELGSVTKVFTASLIAEMDQNGQLSLDDNIDSALPPIFRNPQLSEVSIKDLLIHQSGLPRYPVFKGDMHSPLKSLASYTLDDLLNLYQQFTPEKHDNLMYSNVAYSILEPVLFGLTGRSFEDLLEEHLFLKLNSQSIAINPDSDLAPRYNFAVEPVSPVDFGVFNASGGLRGNMTDLLKFVQYSLFDAPKSLWLHRGMGMGEHLGMALGWHIVQQSKISQIYMHTGRTLGHTAFVGLVPKTKTGVVILANSANSVDDLGLEILRMINKNWKRKY